MSRILRVGVVLAACGLGGSGTARAANILVGIENWRFKTDVDQENVTTDHVAHHSTTAMTAEFRLNKNLSLGLDLGSISSRLEYAGITQGTDDGFYLRVGLAVQTELESGGGMLLDLSYSMGWTEWTAGLSTMEYDHARSRFFVGYAFGRPDRSRLYAGVSYNAYTADLVDSLNPDLSYENDQRFNLVAGIRANTDTFSGVAEVTGLGEWGVRLGLAFGF